MTLTKIGAMMADCLIFQFPVFRNLVDRSACLGVKPTKISGVFLPIAKRSYCKEIIIKLTTIGD